MTKIYKLTCSTNGRIYVGQTKQSLVQRLANHRSDAKDMTSMTRIAQAIRQFGPGAFSIELLEECDDATAEDRESEWIAKLQSTRITIGYNYCARGSDRRTGESRLTITPDIADDFFGNHDEYYQWVEECARQHATPFTYEEMKAAQKLEYQRAYRAAKGKKVQ